MATQAPRHHLDPRVGALLKGVAVAAVVVAAGAALGSGVAQTSAVVAVGAKVMTAIGARYAAKEIVDGALPSPKKSLVKRVGAHVTALSSKRRDALVDVEATALEALGDIGPRITFG